MEAYPHSILMKYVVFLLCLWLCIPTDAEALGRRRMYYGQPRTEVECVNKVLQCLRYKDSISYYYNFPPFDTLWHMATKNTQQSPQLVAQFNQLKEHPTVLIDLDPFYNKEIMGKFFNVLSKGEDSGLTWKGIVLQRYELQKQEITRGMEGLQGVIPERFKGYLFVRDLTSATTFCITIKEIMKFNGFFYGGQVLNVLQAADIDDYMDKEKSERRFFARQKLEAMQREADSLRGDTLIVSTKELDSLKADSLKLALMSNPMDTNKAKKNKLLSNVVVEEEASKIRKEVVDRKFYKGKFDDEIPVELYVRYMKDAKGKVNNWDALYKFGDMPKYSKLEVTKDNEGKWIFEDIMANMELELDGRAYSGAWTNSENQTGYDVEMTQREISQQKIFELDKILETGTWARLDDQVIKEKEDSTTKRLSRRARKKREEEEAKKPKKTIEEPKEITDETEEAKAVVPPSIKDHTPIKVDSASKQPAPPITPVTDTSKANGNPLPTKLIDQAGPVRSQDTGTLMPPKPPIGSKDFKEIPDKPEPIPPNNQQPALQKTQPEKVKATKNGDDEDEE